MEHFDRALKSGKGVIVVTAHLGNWELFGVLQAIAGTKITAVVRHIKNKSLDRMWNRVRTRFGLNILFAQRRMGAMKEMLLALRRGEALALVIDQNMNRDKGIFVDLKFDDMIDGASKKFDSMKDQAMNMAGQAKSKMEEAEAKVTSASNGRS